MDHPRSRGVYAAKGVARSVHAGIIPARAGFTDNQRTKTNFQRDHPRSRGVYPIIQQVVHLRQDHPRSRGVYVHESRPSASHPGSSPLARGLLGPLSQRLLETRIIPARAGFTPAGSWRPVAGRDHPRSRGVYISAVPPGPISMGSSPLARGLRGPCWGFLPVLGIIPARAGFTAPGSCP